MSVKLYILAFLNVMTADEGQISSDILVPIVSTHIFVHRRVLQDRDFNKRPGLLGTKHGYWKIFLCCQNILRAATKRMLSDMSSVMVVIVDDQGRWGTDGRDGGGFVPRSGDVRFASSANTTVTLPRKRVDHPLELSFTNITFSWYGAENWTLRKTCKVLKGGATER